MLDKYPIDKYCLVYNLLEDEISKDLYIRYIKRMILPEYIQYNLIPISEFPVYFHPKVTLTNTDIMCDCGCYDATDLTKFLSKLSNGRIYAFEAIKEYCDRLKIDDRIIVVNKVVSNDNKGRFIMINGDSSRVTSNSDIFVESTTLDEYINEVQVIKMDIEGEEYNALLGCKRLLQYKPKLMISIYHKKEDIIRIPLLLKSYGYKLYLGNHSLRNCDFVLYAT